MAYYTQTIERLNLALDTLEGLISTLSSYRDQTLALRQAHDLTKQIRDHYLAIDHDMSRVKRL